jgi:molybdenum cofactor cytidylyltransferase
MPEGDPEPVRESRITAVILAAGASRRLGEPKQLIQVAGESLLRRSARLALEAQCAPVFAVLGFEAERLRAALGTLPVEVVVNTEWAEGMGSSLRCGVRAARESRPKVDGALVMVCDQPLLTVEHLRKLLQAHRHRQGGGRITASAYAGRAGVPAVFAAETFPELEAVQGDRGAREVLEREHGRVETVDWPEGAVDVDLPEHVPGRSKG